MEEMVTISKKEYENLKREMAELLQQLSEALALIKQLQIEIQLLKNGTVYYQNAEQFWNNFNNPWIDALVQSKTDIVVFAAWRGAATIQKIQ